MALNNLVLRYAIFAVLATVANLETQRLVLLQQSNAVHFVWAIAAGTIVGLVIKYMLDKRWIFYDQETGVKAHGWKFLLYAIMGLGTTAVFWGAETIFWVIWHSNSMRELGAILGLLVGYVAKYMLDRRFVFTDVRPRVTA